MIYLILVSISCLMMLSIAAFLCLNIYSDIINPSQSKKDKSQETDLIPAESTSVESKQTLAKSLLEEGNYLKAYSLYEEIAAEYYLCDPMHLFLKATAAWNLKQYADCLRALGLLQSYYPEHYSKECELIFVICEKELAQASDKDASKKANDNDMASDRTGVNEKLKMRLKHLSTDDFEPLYELKMDS